jgi:hypothetical protein
MRAIVSALQSLERIRIEARVETTELESMRRFSYAQSTQRAQRNKKPHLQALRTSFMINLTFGDYMLILYIL